MALQNLTDEVRTNYWKCVWSRKLHAEENDMTDQEEQKAQQEKDEAAFDDDGNRYDYNSTLMPEEYNDEADKGFMRMLNEMRLIENGPYEGSSPNFSNMGHIDPVYYVTNDLATVTKQWKAGMLTDKGREFLAALEAIDGTPSRAAAFTLLVDGKDKAK